MAKLISVLLGIAVGGLLITAVFLADSANTSKQDARAALAKIDGATTPTGNEADGAGGNEQSDHAHSTAASPESHAGELPDDAAELATQHEPFPAELPPVPGAMS